MSTDVETAFVREHAFGVVVGILLRFAVKEATCERPPRRILVAVRRTPA